MTLTAETLPRHELVGLPVRVVDAADPGMAGIEGVVVRETAGTLCVRGRHAGRSDAASGASRVRQVPKRGSRFAFALTDEAADGTVPPATGARKGSGTAIEPGATPPGGAWGPAGFVPAGSDGEVAAHVTVDGARLHARPAERTATTGDSQWR